MRFKSLEDVMKKLTLLKLNTNGYDSYNTSINDIAGVLALFGVKWEFVVDDKGNQIATLIQ